MKYAAVTYFALALITPAKDLTGIYDEARIAQEQGRLRSRIITIYEEAYRPNLLPDEQRALSGVTIETPLAGEVVLGYYSDSRAKIVSMPAASLLFFEDLSTAFAWLYTKGYRLETIEEYLTMLKYRNARAFGGRYPSPLEALGIPADPLEDPKVSGLAFRIRNSGWAFILGHELGHVRFQHRAYPGVPAAVSQANEEQADDFALELMRRVQTLPMGALLFFQTGIYYFENRADFATDRQWEDYISKTATHPMTAQRLRLLSEHLEALGPDFARGQTNPEAAIEISKSIANGFAEFANFLDDPTLQRVMRAKAERSSVASLAPRRTKETLVDFPHN